MEAFAKGKRGIVYKDFWQGKPAAIKVKNPASKAVGRLAIEAQVLQEVNRHGIGPKLYAYDDGKLVMEFIEGVRIGEFIKKADRKAILSVLQQLFRQLRILDRLGITKGEMTNPYKHVVIKADNTPVLIDFERARRTKKPANVSQFCQYLIAKNTQAVLESKKMSLDKKEIITAVQKYKRGMKERHFKNLLEEIAKSLS